MKNNFLLLLCLVALTVILGCPSAPDLLKIEKYELPPFFISPSDEVVVAKHDFVFVNRSENEIVLEARNATCGCTRFKISPERVAPSGRSVIELSYDLSSSLAKRSESIVVNCDQNRKNNICYTLESRSYPRLEVKGLYDHKMSCVPGEDLQIDILCRGFIPTEEITEDSLILESSSELLKVIDDDDFRCEKRCYNKEAKIFEKRYRLKLKSPSWTDSRYDCNGYSSDLKISYGPHIINTTVRWAPLRKITQSKETLFFNCSVEPAESEHVSIKSDTPFMITGVNSQKGTAVVSYDKDRNDCFHILKVVPDMESVLNRPDLDHSDTIIILTNHPLQPQVRVNVHFMLPVETKPSGKMR